jgi:hypothetical protein
LYNESPIPDRLASLKSAYSDWFLGASLIPTHWVNPLARILKLSPIPAKVGDKTKLLSAKYCVKTGRCNSWLEPKKQHNNSIQVSVFFIPFLI